MKSKSFTLTFASSKYIDYFAVFSCLFFILAGMLVSLHRFWQYEVFYFDFGIFDQAIWKVSRFQPPIVDHFIVGGKLLFADHFSPSLYLLSPLFWITDRSEVLLVAQAVAVGLSGFFLYRIGQKVIGNNFLSLCILLCYFLFVGLQNAVISEFHDLTVMTLPLVLTFWAIVNKKLTLYFLFLLITLGFKEVTFLLGIGIGIAIFFIRKEWRKAAVATMLLSAFWGYVTIMLLIPYFSNGIYVYQPVFPEGIVGKLLAYVDHPDKRKTLFYSMLNFGFLPLFSPAFWFLILQDYTLRFLPKGVATRLDLGLHYNAQTAPLLALSALFSLRWLLQRVFFRKYTLFLGIILVLISFVLYRFVLHGPFALSYNPAFYKHTGDFDFLNSLVDKVPSNASVMAQNNLAVKYAHQKVWVLRPNYRDYKPDYIVMDVREGQNPNNFFANGDPYSTLERLKRDTLYDLIYRTDEQYLFKRR